MENSFITLTKISKFASAVDKRTLTINTDQVVAIESDIDNQTLLYTTQGKFSVSEDFKKVYELITKRTFL